MFSRTNKGNGQNNAAQQPKRTVPSILSADLKITGDINSAGEIQIDGEVSGDIRSEVLLIGETAKIKGEIFAQTIRVHGNINGQIKAKNVHLARTAHVVGDILHENLSIDEGAYIEGHITRMSEATVQPAEDRVNLVVNKAQPPRPAPAPATAPAAQPGAPVAATVEPKKVITGQ